MSSRMSSRMSKGKRARAVWFGAALVAALAGVAPTSHAQPAKTPSGDELKAARELFQEAYKDEQEKRYAQALEKFQRVSAVKESGSVRYRIGSVLELLGRLREARDAFRALAASKPNLAPNEQEIADSAAERAHALDKKIPKAILQLQENSPADARVSIDGAPVPASTTPHPIELDPGEHVVRATSPTSRPSETKITLAEGAQVAVVIHLEPLADGKPAPPPPPETGPHRDNTLAYIVLGAGGVLLISGIAVLVVREGDISDLKLQCRNGVCPAGKMADLQSEHDQAQTFGPLGIGLAAVGLVGIGVGGYLLFKPAKAEPPPSPASDATPSASRASLERTLRLTTRPLLGGGFVGLDGAF